MTITAYVGLPGAGKSYGVVENVIVPALMQKRSVYTNIPFDEQLCLQRFGIAPVGFSTQDIIANPQWFSSVFEAGSLFVFDEVWRVWPAGLKANNVRNEDKSFLAEHRHMVGENGLSTEIVLVTQDLGQVASFARALVETTFRVSKLSKLGLDKRYRVDVFSGPVMGPSPPMSRCERQFLGSYKKEVYALYKSQTLSKADEHGKEARTDQRYKVISRTKVVFLALLFVLGIWFVVYMFGKWKDWYFPPPKVPVAAEVVQSGPSAKPVKKSSGFSLNGYRLLIVYNNGRFPNFDYVFRVERDGLYSDVTPAQLYALGYKVRSVNACLAVLSSDTDASVAMCQAAEEEKGFVEKTVTPVADQV